MDLLLTKRATVMPAFLLALGKNLKLLWPRFFISDFVPKTVPNSDENL
jgi:hypothetical protein